MVLDHMVQEQLVLDHIMVQDQLVKAKISKKQTVQLKMQLCECTSTIIATSKVRNS